MSTFSSNSTKQNSDFSGAILTESIITQAGRDSIQYSGVITINETRILQISAEEIISREFVKASPYKGLKKFESEDKDLFFGRSQAITSLVNELEQNNLILLLGASGSGKSSIVRAGLIPWLSQDKGAKFVKFILTPNDNPFESLYHSLSNKYNQRESLIAKDAKADTLNLVIRKFKQPDQYWLIFIDQFEELFTTSQPKKSDLFLESLVKLHETKPEQVKVVATMRADFTDQLSRYPKFVKATNKRTTILAEMQTDELRLAIEQPAAHHGVVFETGLVDEIIKEIQGQKGCLPLLQYTLNLLWETELNNNLSQERTLKVSTYRQIGGVRGALQQHVDSIYKVLSPEEKQATKTIFLKLVEIGEDVASGSEWKPVRKRVSKSIFSSKEEEKVLTKLIDENLLVSDRPSPSQPATIEITHEILLTSWETLKTWIQNNREAIAIRNRLINDMTQWKNSNKSEDELWSGSKLEQILEKRTDPTFKQVLGEFSKDENEFIDASLGVRDAVRKREKRQLLRLRVMFAGAFLTSLVALLMWINGNRQQQEAKSEKQNAQSRYAQELVSKGQAFDALLESLRLAVPIYRRITASDSEQAGLKSVRLAVPIYGSNDNEKPPMQLITALQEAIYRPKPTILEGHNRNVLTVAYSPDRKILASGSSDGTIKLQNLEKEEVINLPHEPVVNSIAFSPDSQILASGGSNGTVKLWNAKTRKFMRTFWHQGNVTSVAFNPKGKTLASASGNGSVKVWDVKTGKSRTFSHRNFYVNSIIFSPDGKALASASSNSNRPLGKITVFDLKTGKHKNYLLPNILVESVVFNPDSKTIAVGGSDRKIYICDRDLKQCRFRFWHGASITNLAFSPNGDILASTGRDGTVKVWNLTTGYMINSLPHGGWVHSAAFHPNGNTLASGSSEGYVTLWDKKFWNVTTNSNIKTFRHKAEVTSVAFNPDSKTIAVGSNNGTVNVWDVKSKNNKNPDLTLSHDYVRSLAFHPKGDTLASGGNDGTVKLWNVKTGKFVKSLWHGNGSQVASIGFSQTEKDQTLVSGGTDGIVKLWNVETYGMINSFVHGSPVTSVALSRNGQTVASASGDGTIKLWNAKTGDLIKNLSHGSYVYSIAFSHDGQTLASGGGDSMVKVWNVNTSSDKPKVLKHGALVQSVMFNKDDILASGSWNGIVKFWNVQTRQEVGILPHWYYENSSMSLAFSDDGKSFISTSGDMVVLWNLDFKDLVKQGCKEINDYLQNSRYINKTDKELCEGISDSKKQ